MSLIPKVAHFYWYGDGPLTPLREASIDSFRAWNPDWQWFLHRSGSNQDAPLRERVIASDAARYGILSRAGGVYFDTDIVFTKPVPEEWLQRDLLLPVCSTGLMYGVHVLGAKPGSVFFRSAVERARMRLDSGKLLGCQSLGVKLWDGVHLYEFAGRGGEGVTAIPREAYLLTGWADVEDVWQEGGEVGSAVHGVHWYGGDRISNEFEALPIESLPDCMVTRAIKMFPVGT
jgi:hypothetical protein